MPSEKNASSSPGGEALRKRLTSFVTRIDASLNLTVLHTEPGTAPMVAAALDEAALDGVLGTVAGDDTVMIINAAPDGGGALARKLAPLHKTSS